MVENQQLTECLKIIEQQINNINVSNSTMVKKELANRYFNDRKFTDAIELYTELLLEDPSNYYLFSNRSACYIKLSDFDKAYNDAKKCIELKPLSAKAHFRLGTACHGLQNYDEALVAYNKADELEPSENYKNMIDIVKSKLIELKPSISDDVNSDPMFSSMFDKVINNPKLMEKLMDTNFQNKILGLQHNPLQAIQDPDIMNMMQEMMKEIKL